MGADRRRIAMNDSNEEVPWHDGAAFIDNRNRIPAEEQLRHAGRRVAYSLDGTRIVASGRDDEELAAALRVAGIDPSRVVWSYIPGDNEDPLIS
jgi:hypothetical protein